LTYLNRYTTGSYHPGASKAKQILWYYLGSPLFKSYLLPFSFLKAPLLRLFGANLGKNIRFKTGIHIKFPWRLTIGNHCWIGEDTWIDNLAPVTIADNVCLSQGVYLCTGNHDWTDPHFGLRLGTIHLEDSCWIAAQSVIGPGVTVGHGAILTLGSVTAQSLQPMTIYAGNPARPIKQRKIKPQQSA
jgi:putative colanic acid biosynthesis acetyltransferase WcaF